MSGRMLFSKPKKKLWIWQYVCVRTRMCLKKQSNGATKKICTLFNNFVGFFFSLAGNERAEKSQEDIFLLVFVSNS